MSISATDNVLTQLCMSNCALKCMTFRNIQLVSYTTTCTHLRPRYIANSSWHPSFGKVTGLTSSKRFHYNAVSQCGVLEGAITDTL